MDQIIKAESALLESLLNADAGESLKIIEDLSKKNISLQESETLVSVVMDKIGHLWEENQISLAQIYIAGSIVEQIINKRFPDDNQDQEASNIGFAVLSDHHNLGMKIVSSYLKTKGISHSILGVGLNPEELVAIICKKPVKILLLSILMLPSAHNVKKLRQLLHESGLGDIKIIVGGAPFRMDENLWRRVGADAMAINSISTYQQIKRFLSGDEQ